MKKSFLLFALALPILIATAQTNPKKPTTPPAPAKAAAPAKPSTPPPPPPVALKTLNDSFSYAIGMSVANFYKEQGIADFNTNLLVKAINDAKAGKAVLNENQANTCVMNYMQLKKSEKSAAVRKAGEAFLAENKKKPGVITNPSGLQYMILKEGTGPKPTDTDQVKVHYHGTLTDGTIFDSSVERGEPITLGVNGVIQGWVEALKLMPVGSKWRLFIPSGLGYGDNDAGPFIKGGSALIFDVELLEIVKK